MEREGEGDREREAGGGDGGREDTFDSSHWPALMSFARWSNCSFVFKVWLPQIIYK